MFKIVKSFHFFVSRVLLNINIGVRLFSLIALAASVSLLLAVAGIEGLAASKESLRSVYEERMRPIQQLAAIAGLMLNNRILLQKSLSEVDIIGTRQPPAALRMNGTETLKAADAIETNIQTISFLWRQYCGTPRSPEEVRLAERFAASRTRFVNEALIPALRSLRENNYAQTKLLTARAHVLYERADPDLHALNQFQFERARQTYVDGIHRYEDTRRIAIATLAGAILMMVWLGLILNTSIVNPLKQVILIFRRISNGHYDSAIKIQGHDEISKVMLELNKMQTKLGVDERAIHQLAFYDPLTNLPNRRLLRDRLQIARSVSARTLQYGAILMLDLDNFKTINDTLGHDVGDSFLNEISARIQSCIRQSDTFARMGGDEFVIMLTDLGLHEGQAAVLAEAVGEKILRIINQPCMLVEQLHHGSASMGLCLFLGQDTTIEDLFKRADISMYQAKSNGRNALRFYDPQMQTSLEKRISLESELRDALACHQLLLYYQIQVDHVHGVLGAEVLLRWQHPKYGLLLPDQFIPIAEESGLILPMGEWVLRCACCQLKEWESDTLTENFELSVNVSASQFRQADFVALVCQILEHSGANPNRLKLELTESLVLHDVVDTIEKMKALKRLGIQFSMDDFGTGYSSLAHLTNLPIQQLKIDRSFVRNICNNHSDAIIVQTIIGMAKNLGMSVIAEGVEMEAQRVSLESFGCLNYQGYLFGKPMPLMEFEELSEDFFSRQAATH